MEKEGPGKTDGGFQDAAGERRISVDVFESGTVPWHCRLAASAQRGSVRTRSLGGILRVEGGSKAKCV